MGGSLIGSLGVGIEAARHSRSAKVTSIHASDGEENEVEQGMLGLDFVDFRICGIVWI